MNEEKKMKVIYGVCGSGKTTKVIQLIKEFGGILVVGSYGRKQQLVDSNVLGEDQVVALQERHKLTGSGQKYYVDCIEALLEEYLGSNCEGFTIDTFESIECTGGLPDLSLGA